jgi:translation initiation factor 2 subunit 1
MSNQALKEWPDQDELVVAVVDEIVDHGAYVKLEDYGKKGYLPIAEISQGWVTDIRRFVNPGQRVVLRVIRVTPSKGHVDLSLKRVSQQERNAILRAWKRNKKFLKVIEEFVRATKLSQEHKKVILEKFSGTQDPLGVLERLSTDAAIQNPGLDETLFAQLIEYSKKILRPKEYKRTIKFTVYTTQKGGVEKVREVLSEAQRMLKEMNDKSRVYVASAPNYAAEVVTTKPKALTPIVKDLRETLQSLASKSGLTLKIEDGPE